MNFPIFNIFLEFFLNFSKFILDLLDFKKKKSSFYRTLSWQQMPQRSDVSPRVTDQDHEVVENTQ